MKVIYWSQTGNTQKMAELIAKGIEEDGKKAELVELDNISIDDLNDEKVIILGSPASGTEELEETQVEPFVQSLEGKIQGKKVALFGSWGWGEGEYLTNLEERIKSYGGEIVGESLSVMESPEGEDEAKCVEFGKLIAQQ
ncbi:flavodoxin [Sarcina ventriculi]|uniref:flavodoxin n=1 Tax=Sarcina ventriculi TaxID=1267 RepID=UPI001C1112F8|nr:flavodoxin [Sarcina ventriculi]MBU5322836.1 flavodoxin [Sarcina ventriculi]MDO4401549.1 flavodoxin [Clostridiaceae bacterium]